MTTKAISVTEFKAHCLDVIRKVEQGGDAVELTRRGRVVARLVPAAPASQGTPPWLRLRGRGVLTMQPEDSVLEAEAFEAQGNSGR